MKNLITVVLLLIALSLPKAALASEVSDEQIICPGAYGTGVVCGVKTHAPVATGLADNLLLIGLGFLTASGAGLVFYGKLGKETV